VYRDNWINVLTVSSVWCSMVIINNIDDMGKTIINSSNDFFDVGGTEGDVLYSFTGNCGIKSNSVLYGKTINLSEMYDTMLDDALEFLFGGEFVNSSDYNTSNNRKNIMYAVRKYTTKKYGISIESVYNKIQCNTGGTTMTVDIIFNELKVKYGMTGIDWMYLYNNVYHFRTNDVEILEYLSNRILSNEIYGYFVTEYNLRTMGMVKRLNSVNSFKYNIKLEWDNCKMSRYIKLSDMMKSYSHWWIHMTYKNGGLHYSRDNIKEYDLLLNGKSVTEVFPVYCPVFSNLRMNYTGIDFDNGKNNIKKCSEIAGNVNMGETWSFASIDRIDSNKGYSYDNIRIISQYANNLKNVGNIEQMRILLRYMDEQNSYF